AFLYSGDQAAAHAAGGAGNSNTEHVGFSRIGVSGKTAGPICLGPAGGVLSDRLNGRTKAIRSDPSPA
ncbi:MAG: hypothetical protein M0O99_09090, partial [Desulfuromonas thiophila]|nr:hypothetical protein [Desulfuromonas thiophila]